MGRAERDQLDGVDDSLYLDFANRVETANLEAPPTADGHNDGLPRKLPPTLRPSKSSMLGACSTG